MLGKTVIVTGASSGIGLETAFELAKQGARVIMACRDLTKAEGARSGLIDRVRNMPKWAPADLADRLVIRQLNLSSFQSVRSFAEQVLQNERRVDVLINNAGVMGIPERQLTEDGLELAMGTNHFGHFLLTNLLLPILKSSAPSRIIVVTTTHYESGVLRFDNLNSEKSYNLVQAYCTSKLANILFMRHLAKLLEAEAPGVIVCAVNPGAVDTDIRKPIPKWAQLFYGLLYRVVRTPREAALTIVQLVTIPLTEVQLNGQYMYDGGVCEPMAAAKDEAVALQLWEISEKITGLS